MMMAKEKHRNGTKKGPDLYYKCCDGNGQDAGSAYPHAKVAFEVETGPFVHNIYKLAMRQRERHI